MLSLPKGSGDVAEKFDGDTCGDARKMDGVKSVVELHFETKL